MAVSKPQLRLVQSDSGPARLDGEAATPMNATERVLYIERLYHQHRPGLAHYIAGLLPGGRQDADVIVQETYVRLLRQNCLEHLRTNARAYIFTIATNLVRDTLRKHLRRFGDAHESLDEEKLVSVESSPSHNAQWLQSLDRLQLALRDLRPITRQVFLMSRFEEMTYPEIAQVLCISTRTVERHMSLAFKHLQKILEDVL